MWEAVVAGVIVALVWALIAYAYLRGRHGSGFTGPPAVNRVVRKLEADVMCEAMLVEVSGNVLTATARDHQDGPYEATIAMSTDLPNSGRGHYTHLKCVDEKMQRLSGFVEVQAIEDDDTLLVHQWYVSQEKRDAGGAVVERRQVHSPYVWRPI